MTSAPLQDLLTIRRFVLGGAAIFTLVSKMSGARKTFRVEAVPPELADTGVRKFFVSLLTGSDNTSDYRYLALLVNHPGEPDLLTVHANKHGFGVEAYNSLAWLVHYLNNWQKAMRDGTPQRLRECHEHFTSRAEVWHEGKCCRCGRTLTTPESCASGIGPVCAEKGMM